MTTFVKKSAGIVLAAVVWFSSAFTFAAYQPTAALETKVDQVWDALINIIDAKHNSNYGLLLWLLKQFEWRVAGDEKKEWILDQLIAKTTAKINIIESGPGPSDQILLTAGNYRFWESVINAQLWDTITITLQSDEWYHDFVIDELWVASEAISAGETTTFSFVVDQAWTFEYYCSIWNHRAQWMLGMLVVQDNTMMEPTTDSDTMMMEAWIPLQHVAVGQTIRWISFDGSETAQGMLMAGANGGTDLSVYFQNLPATGADNFYEGRLVRKSPFKFISTGPLEMKDGMYVNDRMSSEDYLDFNHYVLTLEPNDNDPAPAEHIFEGDL